jgi:hypothetical protein
MQFVLADFGLVIDTHAICDRLAVQGKKVSGKGRDEHIAVALKVRPATCPDASPPHHDHPENLWNIAYHRLLRIPFAKPSHAHRLRLQRRHETPIDGEISGQGLNAEQQATVDALRKASWEYQRLYVGSAKRALRESLRAGTTGTDEERARMAALERDHQAYSRFKYLSKSRTPAQSLDIALSGPLPAAQRRPPAAAADSKASQQQRPPPEVRASADELAALQRRANEYAREFLGRQHMAKRRRLDAGQAPPAELQRYRQLRQDYNAVRNADHKARRAEWRRRKAAHDRFASEFLGPENAAKRARLEAAGAGGDSSATQVEREEYLALRRAYEEFEASSGSGRNVDSRRQGGRPEVPGDAAPKPPDATADMSAEERAALYQAATKYRNAFLKDKPLARRPEAGSGLPAQQAELGRLRAAYNEYHARLPRANERLADQQRAREEWMRHLTQAERQQLDAVTADHLTYRRLGLHFPSLRNELLADDRDGAKRAEYEALRRADNVWNRLYQRARKRAQRGAAESHRESSAAGEVQDAEEHGGDGASQAAVGLPPNALSPDRVDGEGGQMSEENSPMIDNDAQSSDIGESLDEERSTQIDNSHNNDLLFFVGDDKKGAQQLAKPGATGSLLKGVASVLDQTKTAGIGMLSGVFSSATRSLTRRPALGMRAITYPPSFHVSKW